MISKDRSKAYKELNYVASEECNSLGYESLNMGTIHQDLILLAYIHAPLKDLKYLIKKGKKKLNQD